MGTVVRLDVRENDFGGVISEAVFKDFNAVEMGRLPLSIRWRRAFFKES